MTLLRAWYGVDFPPSASCFGGEADQLQKAFEVMFVTNCKPQGAALFEWHDERLEGNTFFLSPEAVTLVPSLLEHLGAKVCDSPVPTDRLVLLVGDADVEKNLRFRHSASRARQQNACEERTQPDR
jgi:hypothetical protein